MNTIELMLEALRLQQRMHDEALPRFNWGASALDANAIHLLNTAPKLIGKAIAAGEAELKREPVAWRFKFDNGVSATVYTAKEADAIRSHLGANEHETVLCTREETK